MDGLNLAPDTDPVEKIRLLEEEVCELVILLPLDGPPSYGKKRDSKHNYRSRAFLVTTLDHLHPINIVIDPSPIRRPRLRGASCQRLLGIILQTITPATRPCRLMIICYKSILAQTTLPVDTLPIMI